MFNFGKNWYHYVKNVVDEDTVYTAKSSLIKYLGNEQSFKDKTFIDVGCGSGLFSLCAVLLGCKNVISFDILKESVETTLFLKEKFKHLLPDNYNWQIYQSDILNSETIKHLYNKGDIVYSWGVLHHTGQMWKAIENASKMVKQNGYFIFSIYNHALSSKYWHKIKKFYNEHVYLQPILNIIYGLYVCIGFIIKRKTFKLYRERGMHIFYDAVDWIGGYPYEYACVEEIKQFIEYLGFNVINIPTNIPCEKNISDVNFLTIIKSILTAKNTGCNEFICIKNKSDV